MQTQPFRILQVIRQGMVGGGESHLLSLVQHLDRSAFTPEVLSFTPGPMVDSLRATQVPAHVLPSTRPFDPTVWKSVRSFLAKGHYDLVHVHGTRALTNLHGPVRQARVPLVYTVHGWSFHPTQSWPVRTGRLLAERYFTARTSCNIAVSQANLVTGQRAISGFGAEVVPNGIDLSRFDPAGPFKNLRAEYGIDPDKLVIGWVARMTVQKDPLGLLRAFARLAPFRPEAVLLLVGDGELKAAAQAFVRENDLEGRVIFDQFRPDVPDVLNAIDIYCLPSLWEGLPIGLIEAMAMQKAVVTTPVDGNVELIEHEKTGLLVPPQRPDLLADALTRLLEDSALRQQLAQNARHLVQHRFDARAMTRHIEGIYRRVLES